jgi:protein deglycase
MPVAAFALAVPLARCASAPRGGTHLRPGPSMSSVAAAAAPKRALVAIGTGSEEIETATVADVLVRAGCAVTLASVEESATVVMSRGMRFAADTTVSALPPSAPFDAIVLPGGMPGAERLRDCAALEARVRAAVAGGGTGAVVGAICAAPGVCLGSWGLLEGRSSTGYPAPAFEALLGEGYVRGQDVVVSEDGLIVTSRGPATAMAFALGLVEKMYGKEMSGKLAAEMLYE